MVRRGVGLEGSGSFRLRCWGLISLCTLGLRLIAESGNPKLETLFTDDGFSKNFGNCSFVLGTIVSVHSFCFRISACAMLPRPRPRRAAGVSLKMYFDDARTIKYIQDCAFLSTNYPHVNVFIIPDFVTFSAASALLRQSSSRVLLGAQDCFWEDSSAYTGEVSPAGLKRLGCSLVELGHAERRRLFGRRTSMCGRKREYVVAVARELRELCGAVRCGYCMGGVWGRALSAVWRMMLMGCLG